MRVVTQDGSLGHGALLGKLPPGIFVPGGGLLQSESTCSRRGEKGSEQNQHHKGEGSNRLPMHSQLSRVISAREGSAASKQLLKQKLQDEAGKTTSVEFEHFRVLCLSSWLLLLGGSRKKSR